MAKRYSKETVLTAIMGSAGIVSRIADALECKWSTAQTYINKWESTKELYQDECERVLDLAESKLLMAIKDGDNAMIKYLLSTKGKKRGFTEKQEIDHGFSGYEVIITRDGEKKGKN